MILSFIYSGLMRKWRGLPLKKTKTSDIDINLKDEREVTQQCLRICEDAKSYIESLTSRESSLLQEPCQNASEDDSGLIQADAASSPSAFEIEKSQDDIPPQDSNHDQSGGLKNKTSEFRERYGRGFKLTPRPRLSLDNHTVGRFTSSWELPSILANVPDKMRSLLGQVTHTNKK